MISLFHIPFCVSLINILLGYKLEKIFKLELSFRLSFCNLREGMHVIDQTVMQTLSAENCSATLGYSGTEVHLIYSFGIELTD